MTNSHRDLRFARTRRPQRMIEPEDVEAFLIKKAVARHGSVAQAARALGLSRSALYRRLERYGLQ